MWEIYDDLIESIPDDIRIDDCLAGLCWFLVRSRGVGITMTPLEGNRNFNFTGKIIGAKVKDVAELVKSWNFYEAAMGLAAINSYINAPNMVADTFGINLKDQPKENSFAYMKEKVQGKKVAVIGHFRDLEQLAPICELSILERLPQPGDYPDPSCEYILPSQDYVFITGTTLINKTLPRLLELSRNAYVVLTGPSTPLTPKLFSYGVDMLAGTTVIDQQQVWKLIGEGDQKEFFQSGGKMVKAIAKNKVNR